MTDTRTIHRQPETTQVHPWYRYPWPWVAIAIPAIAVVGGLLTLYLAVSNPDPLVVDEGRYQELRSELLADPAATEADGSESAAGAAHHERNADL